MLGYLAKRRLAYTACGIVDDAHERLVVLGIDRQAEISDRILHLLALVERRTAVDTIRNAQFAQFVLYGTRLCVGAIEDGYVLVGLLLGAATLHCDLFGYAQRLVAVGHIAGQVDAVAGGFLGEDLFIYLVLVMVDERVGGLDDGLGRTVVLLQLEEPRRTIVLLKTEYIAYIGSAERVDRLRVVAHDAYVVLRRSQLLDQQILYIVGILILIYEYVAEYLLIIGQYVRFAFK